MRLKIHSTPRRLELQLRPGSLPAYLTFGLLFVAAGLWVMKSLGRSVFFSCGRQPQGGICVLDRRSLLRLNRDRFPVTSLFGSRIDTTVGLNAGTTLMIRTDSGVVPLRLVHANADMKDSLVGVIDGFATDPQNPGFIIEEDTLRTGGVLGGLLLAAGIACLLSIERATCVLDRDKGLAIVRNIRWFGARRIEVPLDRLRGVEQAAFVVYATRSWNLALMLDGGMQIRLTTLPMFNDANVEQASRAIRSWLETSYPR